MNTGNKNEKNSSTEVLVPVFTAVCVWSCIHVSTKQQLSLINHFFLLHVLLKILKQLFKAKTNKQTKHCPVLRCTRQLEDPTTTSAEVFLLVF